IGLRLNGGTLLTVTGSGGSQAFQFPTYVFQGSSYQVTLESAPIGQTCLLSNASGVAGASDVTNVAISCTNRPQYTVGGTISGLTGSLGLSLNGQTFTFSANGSYTFPQTVYGTDAYDVNVTQQPTGQTCLLQNKSGIATANVTNINVTCYASGPFHV